MCPGSSSTDLLSPFHSRRAEPVPQRLQYLSVENADRDCMDLLHNVHRLVAPIVASQLRDEIGRWLLHRNGVPRCIALNRGRGIEDGSFLGMDVVSCYVSYHFVYDTYHTGQSRVVSSFLSWT